MVDDTKPEPFVEVEPEVDEAGQTPAPTPTLPVVTRFKAVDFDRVRIPTQPRQIGHKYLRHIVIPNPWDDTAALVDAAIYWDETSVMIGQHRRSDNYVNVRRLWWQTITPIGHPVEPPHRDHPDVRQRSWSRIHAESRARHLHDRGDGLMWHQAELAPGKQLVLAAGIGVWRDKSPRFKPPQNRWPLLERVGSINFRHQLYPIPEGK